MEKWPRGWDEQLDAAAWAALAAADAAPGGERRSGHAMGRPLSLSGLRPRPPQLDDSTCMSRGAVFGGGTPMTAALWRQTGGKTPTLAVGSPKPGGSITRAGGLNNYSADQSSRSPAPRKPSRPRTRPRSAPSGRGRAVQRSPVSAGASGMSPHSTPNASTYGFNSRTSGLMQSRLSRLQLAEQSGSTLLSLSPHNLSQDIQRKLSLLVANPREAAEEASRPTTFSVRAAPPAARPAAVRARSTCRRCGTAPPVMRNVAVQTDNAATRLARGMDAVKSGAQGFVQHQQWAARTFALLDQDKSGLLSRYEIKGKLFFDKMKECMDGNSVLFTDSEASRHLFDWVMRKADKDGDGLLSAKEFRDFTWRLRQLDGDGLEQQFVFAVFDQDGDGSIDAEEFRKVFDYQSRGGAAVSSEGYISQSMAEVDRDGDGKITKQEFQDWQRSQSQELLNAPTSPDKAEEKKPATNALPHSHKNLPRCRTTDIPEAPDTASELGSDGAENHGS